MRFRGSFSSYSFSKFKLLIIVYYHIAFRLEVTILKSGTAVYPVKPYLKKYIKTIMHDRTQYFKYNKKTLRNSLAHTVLENERIIIFDKITKWKWSAVRSSGHLTHFVSGLCSLVAFPFRQT